MKQLKREAILEAALELFEGDGYGSTTMPAIAAKAGVAAGTVYRYFESKEDLANAAYRKWRLRLNTMILSPAPTGLSPRRSFAHYWGRMIDFAEANPNQIRFLELSQHEAYLTAENKKLAYQHLTATAVFISMAKERGAVRDLDPELAASFIWGALLGLIRMERHGPIDRVAADELETCLWLGMSNQTKLVDE
jgi:AcrR family transcriptional regulator